MQQNAVQNNEIRKNKNMKKIRKST